MPRTLSGSVFGSLEGFLLPVDHFYLCVHIPCKRWEDNLIKNLINTWGFFTPQTLSGVVFWSLEGFSTLQTGVRILHNRSRFFLNREGATGRNQQIIRRQVKASTELFQCQDCRSSFASGNVAKVSGTEVTSFGGGFIAEFAGVAQSEDGRG